ncbi:MAG: guanylate kinase [Phycisphaerae bacterium]
MTATGKLVVISGPAGVGKSTIVERVLALTGAARSVSMTTRRPRANEVDGRDYYFVDRPRFEEMVRNGELLEWADVFGNLYGTPEAPVRKAMAEGRTIILAIDVQGGVQVYRKMPDATFILILPPSMEALEQRLRKRRSEDEASLRRRLGKAKEEIAIATGSGAYRWRVVNDELEQAVREVADIVKGTPKAV